LHDHCGCSALTRRKGPLCLGSLGRCWALCFSASSLDLQLASSSTSNLTSLFHPQRSSWQLQEPSDVRFLLAPAPAFFARLHGRGRSPHRSHPFPQRRLRDAAHSGRNPCLPFILFALPRTPGPSNVVSLNTGSSNHNAVPRLSAACAK
jgi:hypothetical protein